MNTLLNDAPQLQDSLLPAFCNRIRAGNYMHLADYGHVNDAVTALR